MPDMTSKKSFTIVEVLLAVALFVATGTVAVYLLIDAEYSNQQAKDRFSASTIAEAGIEATRSIHGEGWGNLTNGNHGLLLANGVWNFSGESDTDTSGRFSRQINISQISDDQKLITSTVSRISGIARPLTISFSTYLTNYLKISQMPPSWDKPAVVGTAGTGVASGDRNPFDIFVLGNYAYIGADRPDAQSSEFFIFDISNPNSPFLSGSLATGKRICGVYVVGDYAFLATQASASNRPELVIVDVGNKIAPIVSSRITLQGSAYAKDVFVNGNYAYVSTLNNSGGEFYVVDVTNPGNPAGILGTAELGGNVNAISYSNNLVYAATSHNSREMQIINVANPTSPSVVKTYDNPGSADGTDILISGSNLFITTKNNGSNRNYASFSVDASNPSNIQLSEISQINLAININALSYDAGNNQIFLATELPTEEIKMYDVTDPSAPAPKIGVDLPANPTALFFNSTYLFAAQNLADQQLVIIGPGQ